MWQCFFTCIPSKPSMLFSNAGKTETLLLLKYCFKWSIIFFSNSFSLWITQYKPSYCFWNSKIFSDFHDNQKNPSSTAVSVYQRNIKKLVFLIPSAVWFLLRFQNRIFQSAYRIESKNGNCQVGIIHYLNIQQILCRSARLGIAISAPMP